MNNVEAGNKWLELMKQIDACRNNNGPGTDYEASLQKQADEIGPGANWARVQYYNEKAKKVRDGRGPGTDSEDAYLKLANQFATV
ncbi:hypothetical protein FWC63_02790 [Candidatus Saccharibacteria bacterium]|nr:hypothetical protein [Candidatus Saccharibacteria bacterium]